jgi:hypothetical protein
MKQAAEIAWSVHHSLIRKRLTSVTSWQASVKRSDGTFSGSQADNYRIKALTCLWHYAIKLVTKDEFKKLRQMAGHTQLHWPLRWSAFADGLAMGLANDHSKVVEPRRTWRSMRQPTATAERAARAALKEAKAKGAVPWAKIKKT